MPDTAAPSDDPPLADQAPALWPGALEEARSLIGVDMRRRHQTWNTEAAPDSVRHFCWDLGDENPLFCDPAYGATTQWRSGLAPGGFRYTIDTTVVAPNLCGIQWLYGGTDWEWYRPIRHRDSFSVKAKLLDAVEKRGGKASAFIIQTGEVLYTHQHGERVCRAIGHTARTPRAKASGGLKHAAREPQRCTPEQLEHIGHALDHEQLRGATPRHWEEVELGSWIPPLLKVPLTITDMSCWYSGDGHGYQAHRRAHRQRKCHPADAFVNPDTGAQHSAARGHTEGQMAREVGRPGGYDVGPQRISWLGQLMTHGMGDDGFLRRLSVRLRRPNVFGDLSWCRARVLDQRIEDGVGLVELELTVVNQLEETTAQGTALVALPLRAGAVAGA